MHAGLLIALVAIALLVGFIVLQRRRPQDADELASAADSLWKRILKRIRRKDES